MSHPFCATHEACDATVWPQLGWSTWNGKAIYIRTEISDSVSHRQAAAEAIARWNDAVGARILLAPDQGDDQLVIQERDANEWPFSQWPVSGIPAAGLTLNYDMAGGLLGAAPGQIRRSVVYVNRSATWGLYYQWLNVFVHEMGHAFGLADHPHDDINSVMSYQIDGRTLFAPSAEDEKGVVGIYSLPHIAVRPEELEGIENVDAIWHLDRYGNRTTRRFESRPWAFWNRTGLGEPLVLKPHEVYYVQAKEDGTLGYGRFQLPVRKGSSRWMYL